MGKLSIRVRKPSIGGNPNMIILLTSVWCLLGSFVLKVLGTGLPWIQYIIDLFANLIAMVGLLGLIFSIWQKRRWIKFWMVKSPLKVVVSPTFDAFLINKKIFNRDLNDQRYYFLPMTRLVNGGFSIVALPSLLSSLTTDEMVDDLNAFLAQNHVSYRVTNVNVKNGWVYYRCRPNNRKDRLKYG